MNEEDRSATFLLFNLSGKLVGYQVYKPDKDKTRSNDPRDGRYFSYASKEDKTNYLSPFGLESLDLRDDILFVTEGIFKAIALHNVGYPAIATLTNNPKGLKNFLYILSKTRRIIVLGDNDEGGSATRSMGYEFVLPPARVKDIDELSEGEIKEWLKNIL